MDDSEPRRQASASMSKKEEPLTIGHKRSVSSNVPATATPNDLPILVISISDSESDNENTPPEDVSVITISDTSSGSSGDHRPEFKDALDVVPQRLRLGCCGDT